MTISVLPSRGILVKCCPNNAAATGAANWGTSGSLTKEFLTTGNPSRIRQTGKVLRFKFAFDDKQSVNEFSISIWRKSGTTYNRIHTTSNLISQITDNTVNTIDLENGFDVIQGDFIGYKIVWNMAGTNLHALTGITYITSYAYNGIASDTNFDWESQTSYSGSYFPIEAHIESPQLVTIGDSLIGRYDSYISNWDGSTGTSIAKELSNLMGGVSYQNMGIGSQRTDHILARFQTDVVDLCPAILVMDGGANDVGVLTTEQFLSNWTSMLDMCVGIKTYVMSIPSITSFNSVNSRQADSWNVLLKNLIETSYPQVTFISVRQNYGQFRTAGDAGNFWNLRTDYNSGDDVHPNDSGIIRLATIVYYEWDRIYLENYKRRLVQNNPYSLNIGTSGAVSVTSNDAFNFDYTADFTILGWVNPQRNSTRIAYRRTAKGYALQTTSLYGGYVLDFFVNDGANRNYAGTRPHFGWTCAAAVMRSGYREIWGDGVLEISTQYTYGSFAATGQTLNIYQIVATGFNFNGGPIRIYNRALTPTEIKDYYWYGIEPSSLGLLLRYDLTEGSGSSLTDLSGNGYNGTFTGSVTWNSTNCSNKQRLSSTRQSQIGRVLI